MSRVRLSSRSEADLHSIWNHIGIEHDRPPQATAQIDSIHHKIEILATQPELGERRDDLRPGLRSSTVGSYVVFYFPLSDGIEVVAIIHSARDVESLFRSGEV